MKQFFTVEDLRSISYIPQAQLPALVDKLNAIVKTKVAGQDEGAWAEFLREHPAIQTNRATGQDVQARQ